ncbi:hypothetical protein EVAR_58986_1 [Eumeta japonica]|uniref:Uncharacterized protein n=1 Tax=Eumeta variegata TaxID=151549 RepID=A0A4C1YJH9_EUMVA|nr:hypothetical protein EVAR_58986_1 [Eumeta japonica]
MHRITSSASDARDCAVEPFLIFCVYNAYIFARFRRRVRTGVCDRCCILLLTHRLLCLLFASNAYYQGRIYHMGFWASAQGPVDSRGPRLSQIYHHANDRRWSWPGEPPQIRYINTVPALITDGARLK